MLILFAAKLCFFVGLHRFWIVSSQFFSTHASAISWTTVFLFFLKDETAAQHRQHQ